VKDKFEERLQKIKKLYRLTDEEKKSIMERILKREKKFSFIYLIPVFSLLVLIIYLFPHQISFLTPNFVLDENESIKRIGTYIEIYFSNPIFLTQMIYYLLILLSVISGLIFVKIRLNIKGGR